MLQGDVGVELGRRVAVALRTALGVEITPAEALVRPSTREGVDYQCNVAMSLAKTLKKAPREVAQAVVEHLDSADLVEAPEIAGPGFVNLVLRREWLEEQAAGLLGDDRLGVATTEAPRRVAIDLSSPNVAKEMHVGHLRSSIIGDAIMRLLRFAGHEVIPHNHLGDWGTPFGMLIEHLVDEGWKAGSEAHSISDLNGFYVAARKKFDADPDFVERARLRVVALQGGDEETLALWRGLVEESTRHFEKVYELLGIGLTSEDIYGESFYNPFLADTVAELEAKGLTEVSDGALCVFPPGFSNREGDRLPLIIRKSDGGYNYASTDLATIRYWIGEREVTDLLYVVGTPQSQHFTMVSAAARQAGWLTDQHAEHVGFGSILGPDGKMFRSRSGDSIPLAELLDEAVDRAAALTGDPAVAEAVGVGAIKYADLSSDRLSDYVFDWDRMLALTGNTGPYLQYAYARIRSLFDRAGDVAPGVFTVGEPAERALALELLAFEPVLEQVAETLEFHRLAVYLHGVAAAFSTFYERCPVLKAPPGVRASRLALCDRTARTLREGLSLLGIATPERM